MYLNIFIGLMINNLVFVVTSPNDLNFLYFTYDAVSFVTLAKGVHRQTDQRARQDV